MADIDKIQVEGTTYNVKDPSAVGQVIQYTTLPTPSAATMGMIVQYIGDTTADYIQGEFYQTYNLWGFYYWKPVTKGIKYIGNVEVKRANELYGSGTSGEVIRLGALAQTYGNGIYILKDNVTLDPNNGSVGSKTYTTGTVIIILEKGFNVIVLPNTVYRPNNRSYDHVDKDVQYLCLEAYPQDHKTDSDRAYSTAVILTHDVIGKALTAGYSNNKTQTLKNINGTLTWVDD